MHSKPILSFDSCVCKSLGFAVAKALTEFCQPIRLELVV
jgi:hypothetical protein